MKKVLTFLLATLLSLSVLFSFGCNDYKYDDVAYSKFNEISNAKYLIPGLDTDFIPQGMDYWDEEDLVVVSGYFKENNEENPSSVLYTISGKNGKIVKKYNIKNVNDTYHTSHAGGVAVTNKNVFVVNGKVLYRISLSQLKDEGNSLLKVDENISVPARGSFCNFANGMLWVGDFYVNGNPDHALPTDRPIIEGQNSALPWTLGYKLNDSESEIINWNSAMEYATPDYVLLTGETTQGLTFVNNQLVLSKSYSRNNPSNIIVYKNPLEQTNYSTVKLNNVSVPVYNLSRIVTYKTMPMSEGICCKDNKLLVLFESGAKFFKDDVNDPALHPTDRIWEMNLSN